MLMGAVQELMSCYFQSGWQFSPPLFTSYGILTGPPLFRNWVLLPLPQIRMTTLKSMEVPQKCKQAPVRDIVALVLRQTP